MAAQAEPRIHTCECTICQAGGDPQVMQRHAHINLLLSRFSEPQRRWYVGFLAQEPDSPGLHELARITGLARNTIRRGRDELAAGLPDLPPLRQRHVGGGRPAAEKKTRSSKR